MSTERTKYASSILTSKDPLEATEIIRVRLSQAKLINKEFYLFFKELADLKKSYSQQLRKIIAKNEDLEKLLAHDMLEANVLTPDEMRDFHFDSLGALKAVWASVISELKTDLQTSTELYLTLDKDVVVSLKNFTETDPRWTESRKLHSTLSQIAANIDYNKRKNDSSHAEKLREANYKWDSQAADLFELFESTDYNRLLCLKECLLKFQSGFGDSLNQSLQESEKIMDQITRFEPEAEIDRFAKSATEYNFHFASPSEVTPSSPTSPTSTKTASTPSKSSHRSFGNFTNRLSSSGTVIKHDLMKKEFSDDTNNTSLKGKKSSHKLRSRMGSIFGRNKLKNKKSGKLSEHAIPESESSSLRTAESVAHTAATSNHRLDSSHGAEQKPVAPEPNSTREEPPTSLPKPTMAGTSSTLSIHQPPLQPQSREKPLPSQPSQASSATPDSILAGQPTELQSPPQQQVQSQLHPQTHPLHIQAPQPPQPPPSRKAGGNIPLDGSREPHGSVPAVSHTPRRDVQSKLFTDLSQTDIDAQRYRRHSSLSSQMTGEMKMLNPQATGSSMTLPISGQSIFQHSELTSFGLNASIAEVINATFKDGILESSQLIGEIALNYISDGSDLPIDINLKMSNVEGLEKVIVNQAFIEPTQTGIYKINPQFIHSKTLGALKYSLPQPIAPIVIHPAWRFEEHQASVVLTLKIAPTVPESVQELILDDLIVFVAIEGANPTSALSKPQGSFSKEKKRITWRSKEPLVLKRDGEERFIARFLTDGLAHESPKGVMSKFTIKNSKVGSGLILQSQEVDVNDPFVTEVAWQPVSTATTLVAGSYHGLA
ncbi:LAFE_0G03862g1_1 [Lachancea fermentati]|uniref:LAFE_0G03862g1_1 n=1 Tax=Lachancea fermentati TaxID=4955 RepID=A0A1G4MH30_LACFM|nr:LAFE_0G03862g1_1 [Lachancea fermentati]